MIFFQECFNKTVVVTLNLKIRLFFMAVSKYLPFLILLSKSSLLCPWHRYLPEFIYVIKIKSFQMGTLISHLTNSIIFYIWYRYVHCVGFVNVLHVAFGEQCIQKLKWHNTHYKRNRVLLKPAYDVIICHYDIKTKMVLKC